MAVVTATDGYGQVCAVPAGRSRQVAVLTSAGAVYSAYRGGSVAKKKWPIIPPATSANATAKRGYLRAH